MFINEPKALSIAASRSIALLGLNIEMVNIEVQLSQGLPSFSIVGLPDKAVAESKDRIRSALSSMGLGIPPKKIVVNLAPAALVKEGGHLDLPIALSLLAVLGIIPKPPLLEHLALGELALDSTIRPVPGILPAALSAAENSMGLICPFEQGGEAAWVGSMVPVLAPKTLFDLIRHFKGEFLLPQPSPDTLVDTSAHADMRDVKGQESAKRAIEIAAAGGHNILMIGPPGSGKSMLASRLPGLLPALQSKEILEVGMIRSVSGREKNTVLSPNRPYRSPHHNASMAAMVGGGHRARPGEVSMAHLGVLFLDELAEFGRQVLEALRQPIEAGYVSVARANAHVTYPARFQLVAAMNPCRCGHLSDPVLACSRAPKCAADYQRRVSGPMLDRIDIRIDVPAMAASDLALPTPAEGSADIRARVETARSIQRQRYKTLNREDLANNAEAEGLVLDQITERTNKAVDLLEKATQRLRLSARGYYRVLRVARTIADLDGADIIDRHHLSEALAYRGMPAVANG